MTKEELRRTMDEAGWSAARVAEALGVSLRTVRYWMSGEVPMRFAHAVLLERLIRESENG